MTKKIKKPKLPKGVSQEDFLTALDNITKRLASKFRFAYHSIDDMKQQAAIFALEGLKNYDTSRPLENFLWTHVRNRLFNYKRNNYQRPDNPCITCPFFDKHLQNSNNQCSKFLNTYGSENEVQLEVERDFDQVKLKVGNTYIFKGTIDNLSMLTEFKSLLFDEAIKKW